MFGRDTYKGVVVLILTVYTIKTHTHINKLSTFTNICTKEDNLNMLH